MNTNLAYQGWQDPFQEELISGKVVLMSPRPNVNHNQVAFNIAYLFRSYLKGKSCTPFADGTDVYLTEKDRFIPDMMVVCDRSKIQADGIHGAPDLVVEVLSPSTAKNDRQHKKDVYAQCGVREYWIVSSTDKSVEQYLLRDGQFTLHEIYSIYPDWMLKAMSEDERAAVPTAFKCSLYDDFEIELQDIFDGMLE